MRRRNAVTLVEVLVAIFVMGIGLMALLTLFPLGALRMASAIQDNQSTHAAANANALANARDIRRDPNVVGLFSNPDPNNQYGIPNLTGTSGPGYPVFVDAIGSQGYGATTYGKWVGGNPGLKVPRGTIALPFIATGTIQNPPEAATRWFSALDDYQYAPDGTLSPLGQREGKYSWAYMLRKPRLDQALVDMAIVVYMSRPTTLNSFQPQEYVYPATFNASAKTVTLTWVAGNVTPPVRPGSWILDVSQGNSGPHSSFYRVVSVTETSGTTVELEVNVPFLPARDFLIPNVSGTIIVMDTVIDVYEKGTGWGAP